MNYERALGFYLHKSAVAANEDDLLQYINLKLAALNQPTFKDAENFQFLEIARPLLWNHQEKNRLLSNYLCPADRRIQDFLDDHLKEVMPKGTIKIPVNTFLLDRHGLARLLSIPPNRDHFESDIVSSYRVKQGILHNPKNDRRTTEGVFHIAEGGLPIPDDKKAVPKNVFGQLLFHAFRPPIELLRVPFTSSQTEQATLFISLLLRPTVCPEVAGFTPRKSMEIRFFAPGNLISNLDFVESIFGNAGDPYLPENDAGLDVDHWTGHTGCVILAPHLIHLKKKDLGLPHESQATERQRRDGMYWKHENENYNNGSPFKITCRDDRGVMVTLIADNYFGYCKKEVKTQISYSSNLYGLSEEEHSGGAIAFPSYVIGDDFNVDESVVSKGRNFGDVIQLFGDNIELCAEGHAIDKTYRDIIYVPHNAKFSVPEQTVSWMRDGREERIKLLASHTYILPNGYKIKMEKQPGGPSWRLIGTVSEGTFCHKPCTVSGGGKSEISKSITDSMIQGPVFTADFQLDFDRIEEILARDYSDRFRNPPIPNRPSRPILSDKRSLGSVIKLFTPSPEYTDAYNAWLKSMPHHIREIIFVIKRYYRAEWGENWRQYFSVDVVNGYPGYELKVNNRKLVGNYLRVGREEDGSWRIYKTRHDFNAAEKLQAEDDITTSVVISRNHLENLNPDYVHESIKLVTNCEFRLFQRPDDCIHRGYDKQAESDIASHNVFLSNFEPLIHDQARDIMEDAIGFDLYSEPVKRLIHRFMRDGKPRYFVSSAHPRLFEGKPSKNPRYLQDRPDLVDPRKKYIAEIGAKLSRKILYHKPVHFPVNAVLPGRRNNPPDPKAGIPPLAAYNPIHYQELPELFMDFICSVTGKSPSTTGFGSEGALTKGPFNALWPVVDLNNALVSYILTNYQGFTSAAGYVGPNIQVDHDISLLIPEIWSRMTVQERDPKYLIREGYLEKLDDFDFEGRKILASRLGYRITIRFAHAYLGRIFNNPNVVFSPEMLKPELQSRELFIEGIENIVATQKRVAEHYFLDGSIAAACPPLKVLLYIMVYGHFEGKDLNHPEIRAMFERDYLLASDWYHERLITKQMRDIELWTRHVLYLESFIRKVSHAEAMVQLGIHDRLAKAKESLEFVKSATYLDKLRGTIGADPLHGQVAPIPSSNMEARLEK